VIQKRMRWHTVCLLAVLLCTTSACRTARPPSAGELAALDSPPPELVAWLDATVPATVRWYDESAAELSQRGRPLTEEELALARSRGVEHPERVRVVVETQFPQPADPDLRARLQFLGLGSRAIGGLTMGYAILLKPRYAKRRWILAHELVHVRQLERLGSAKFLRRYFTEAKMLGYAQIPLELEADGRWPAQIGAPPP
jgi:hypothetical protein